MAHREKKLKPNTKTRAVKETEWSDLPEDVIPNILRRLSVIDILESAQRVCTAWRRIYQDPSMWRVIDMGNTMNMASPCELEKMCMHVIHRSQGQLVDLRIEHFPTNDLIDFLAHGQRSSQLRRLRISHCYGSLYKSWSGFLKKAPLEKIALTFTIISEETVADISRYCPMLKSFAYNNNGWKYSIGKRLANQFVIAVAKGMPQLLHLQLTGSEFINKGLKAILDGCPNLQSLDLCGCSNINLNRGCGKLCKKRIKNLRLPGDSMEDHVAAPYDSDDDKDWLFYSDDENSAFMAEYRSLL